MAMSSSTTITVPMDEFLDLLDTTRQPKRLKNEEEAKDLQKLSFSSFSAHFPYGFSKPQNSLSLPNKTYILVVDDSPVARKLIMRRFISPDGILPNGPGHEMVFEVDCVENGEKALELCENASHRYDVLIIDQILTDSGGTMFGDEVVSHIRRNAAFSHAVIVGCTGFSDREVQMLYNAGCDTVWNKPVPDVASAQGQVRSLVETKRAMATAKFLAYVNNTPPPAIYKESYTTSDSGAVFQQATRSLSLNPNPLHMGELNTAIEEV